VTGQDPMRRPTPPRDPTSLALRPGTGDDAEACGRVCYEAFHTLAEKVVQVMTLMTLGLYNEPAGAYLPSVLY